MSSNQPTVLASPGALLQDRYLVIKKIGAGNFGSCWLSEDSKRGNVQCVVKQGMFELSEFLNVLMFCVVDLCPQHAHSKS